MSNVIDARKMFETIRLREYTKIYKDRIELWSYTETFNKRGEMVDRSKPAKVEVLYYED